MGKSLKVILAKLIRLASKVTKAASDAYSFEQECCIINLMTEKLALLLRKIPQDIEYDRAFFRTMGEVEKLLDKTISLLLKCPTSTSDLSIESSPDLDLTEIYYDLESCLADVNWLFNLLEYNQQILSLYTISINSEILECTWSYIAGLYHSFPDTRHKAAVELVSFSRDRVGNKKIIIEEGCVFPLLKILKHGEMEDKELAVMIFWNLGYDSESVQHIVEAVVFSVLAEILKEGPMKLQAEVASAVSNFAQVSPTCQDICVQTNIVRLLINHLSQERVQIINKATSVLAFVRASSHSDKAKTLDCNEDN